MAITDAKVQVGLPVGATRIRKADGTAPTVRYVPVGESLLANGGFESDAAGWTALNGNTAARSTAQAKVGSASLKLTVVNAGTNAAWSDPVTVHPGARYALRTWARPQTSGVRFKIGWYDAADVFISSDNTPFLAVASAWRHQVVVGVAPPHAVKARVIVEPNGAGATECYVDAVTLQVCVPVVESPYTEPTTAGAYAGGSLTYDVRAGAHHAGDVRVYDMGALTDGTLAGSSYTRARGSRHKFVGDVLLDNGILRVRLTPGYGTRGGLRVSCLVDGAWQSYWEVLLDTAGDTDASLRTPRLLTVSAGRAAVAVSDTLGNGVELVLLRGRAMLRVTTTRVASGSAGRQDVEITRDLRWSAYNGATVLGDDDVDGSTSVAGTSLTEPYHLALDNDVPFLLALAFNRKPTTLHDTATETIWRLDAAGTSATRRTFWVIAIPWPWLTAGALFKEAEAATLGSGVATGSDGAASGGQVAVLNAAGEFVRHRVRPGVDFPLGHYTLVARARDTNQVTSDFRLQVHNVTDGAVRADAFYTLGAGFAYRALDVEFTSADDGDEVDLYAYKETGTANEVYADYFLLIPRKRNANTPTHVLFPRDVARDALMTTTARETVRRVA